jgi:hypothetical protein
MVTQEEFIEAQAQELEAAKTNAQTAQNQTAKQSIAYQELEKNMVKEQLDLSEEIDTIEHLLKGHVLRETEYGTREWAEPDDPNMKILTEHGIYLIMNTIMFYINKNTLLSNYDEETINKKMEDFSTDLADTIFMESEKVFKKPSFDECKQILMERIERKTNLRAFALELIGEKPDKEQIKKGFIDEIEEGVEKEIDKISEQLMKNKYKRFMILIREIQDAVHSTYLRAYGGQERRTLRQHIHISENVNPTPIGAVKKPSKLNILNYGQ